VHRHLMLPNGADRLLEENLAPVDLLTELSGEHLGDVLRGDGAVEPPLLADASEHLNARALDAVGQGLLGSLLALEAPRRGGQTLLGFLDAAWGRHLGQTLRNQIVAGI